MKDDDKCVIQILNTHGHIILSSFFFSGKKNVISIHLNSILHLLFGATARPLVLDSDTENTHKSDSNISLPSSMHHGSHNLVKFK